MFGTEYAAAPEILEKTPYTRKVDSWGVGVIMYFTLFGQVGGTACALCLLSCGATHSRARVLQPPFSKFGGAAEFHTRVIKARFQKTEPTWSSLSDKAKDLLGKLLVADADKVQAMQCSSSATRFTFFFCCSHPQRLPVESILKHPWFTSLTPQAAFHTMSKRTRRLSGLMRHALMRGVVPPSAPRAPPPSSAKRKFIVASTAAGACSDEEDVE